MNLHDYKRIIKSRAPLVYSAYSSLTDVFHSRVFNSIYRDKVWRSTSGDGSTLAQTHNIRGQITALIKDLQAKSVLDLPCGNHLWMNQIEMKDCRYIGGDIVKDLVVNNRHSYSGSRKEFVVLDITSSPLPEVDLIICRDCLVHFSRRLIVKAVRNIKMSRSTYLLTTTFTTRISNDNIKTGDWRPLNLQKPPFKFPQPILILNEGCSEASGAYQDKSLGLWRIEELPDFA